MCLQQSSSNSERPEAGAEESSIPSSASVPCCVQDPEWELLKNYSSSFSLVMSSQQHNPTAPMFWDSRSPWLSASKLHAVLLSIYSTSHLCRLSSLPFLP